MGTTRNENYLNCVFLLKMAKAKQGKYLTKQDITHLSEAQRMQELEMYTGNKKQIPREEWLYNFESGSISKDIITLPECIERCFLEPLTNASDNVHRSRRFDVVAGKLYVFVSSTRIIIENRGTPIPVAYKEDEGMYVPELIFGVPGSSSHYTEEIRHEAGVNGLGVKLTNVFSKYFEIEILDPINKKSYKQVWENMGLEGKHEPIVEPYNKKESLVRVIFDLDYGHFGYTNHQAPKEVFPLFARHCADISFTTKVPVTFEYEMPGAEPQAIEFEVGHPRNYAYLYFGEAVENSLLHYEWPKGTKIIKHEDGQQTSKNPKVIPLVEMCVVDTPDNSENISFVNSMMTRDGGVHVEAALKSVSDHIVKFVNSKDEDGLTITLKHVRPNISLVMACMVKNPSFSGQTKNKLSGPKPFTPRIDITEKEVKPVMKWQMIQHLLAILEAKKNALLAKSDGKKSRNVSTKNGRNANHAGKRRSKECTLFIVEGLSASSYPKKWVDNIENGRDFYGWLPIRGKFLNVMKAKAEKIGNNREIAELKKMLRLEEGLDYADPENFKRLRYGRVVIMADSDDDGKHIVALLLLYFHCRFPSLLQMGYVYNYLTPIIRVIKGKRSNKFYTAAEYEKWKRRNKNHHTWKTIYFKGLGRTTDAQIREDYMDQRIIHCLYDDYAPQTIRLAFSTQQRDERKAWLAHFSKVLEAEIVEQQPISEFINTELVKYGQLGLRRAIPNEIDGFKDSQRKVMWGAFKIWDTEKDGKIKCGNAKYKEMKVARIAARAAEHTNYHHGERSLEGTIVAMAQDFPGANNLPFFARDGQFGCVDPDTDVLLWNGRKVKAKHIQVGDELIGDDGEKRKVHRIVNGIDDMYEINQTFGESYIVNSIHILTLIIPSHKSIFWKKSTKSWVMNYYDRNSRRIKCKTIRTSECKTKHPDHHNKANITKEEAYKQLLLFSDTIPNDNIVDIRLSDYLKLSNNQKRFFFGFNLNVPVKWEKQAVPIDPYIFGAWLGDGDYCGRGFTTVDPEIVRKYCLWANTIGAEIVHHRDNDGNTYHFGIRRRGSGHLYAIGHPDHSSKTCPGCLTSKMPCIVCDWHPDEFIHSESRIDGTAINGMRRSDMNPFKEILKKNNLFKNKHIPDVYVQNDEETRLKVLAGFIDTDGTVRLHSNGIGCHVEISQKNDIHGHLLVSAATIASSLGFKTRFWKTSRGMDTLAISGYGLHKIPTVLPHKKIPRMDIDTLSANPYVSRIEVKHVGRGKYCGWYIDGNERFLLGDYTVTHNTRDMGGKDAADARYAETKPEWWIPYVFRREDLPILELKEDEGEEIEPVSFYPILPTVLINGCNGIALAYSTFIPNHNPIDVINWLKAKIEGKSLPLLKPWYRGFSGSIEVIDRRTKTRKRRAKQLAVPEERVSDIPDPEPPTIPSLSEFNDNEQDTITTSEEEQNNDEPDFMKEIAEYVRDYREERGRPLYSLITKGEFYTAKNGKVVITELPIGRWTHPYLKWLEKLRDEDKVIKDVRDVSKSDVPGFELTGFQPIPSYKSLQLKSQIGMSNMVLLDTENKPHRYDTVTDYLEVFYKFRLSKYEVRKAFILEDWSKKIHDLREKQRFIRAVVNKELIIESRSKEDVFRDMDEMGMEHALLTETQVVKLTEDEITKLEDKINVLQNDIETLEATSPEKLWLQELREFEREYRKYYKLPARGDKLRIKIKTGH